MPSMDIIARLKLAGERFSSDYEQSFGGLERRAKEAGERVGGTFTAMSKVAAGALAGIGVAGIAAAASQALDYASSLGEVAQQLGVTTKDLQVYRYAASQVGVEQDTMDKGLQKLTQTIGKAALGAKAPAEAFAAMGVNIRDANGHLLTAGQVLPQIAESLLKVTDPAQRAAAELAIFGKAGQQLDTLLAGGKGQINELADAAEHLGLVLSDEQIQNADATADKISELKQVLDARIAGVVADNAQAIYTLADSFIKLASSAGGAITAYGKWAAVSRLNAPLSTGVERQGARDELMATAGGRRALFEDIRGRRIALDRANEGNLLKTDADEATYRRKRRMIDLEYQQLLTQTPTRKDPPKAVVTPEGANLPKFLAGSGSKPKSAGKSDADREADQRAKDSDRVSKSLDEQIAKANEATRIDRIRLVLGDREADAQEVMARVREQNRDIIERTVPELQKAYGWTEKQAMAEQDRVRALEDAAKIKVYGADDERLAAKAADKRARDEEEVAQKEKGRLDRVRLQQEQDIRSLADIYRSAFDGGTGSVWKRLKQEGEDVIAELAARYTLALLAGRPTDLGSILSSAQGTGSPLGGLLGTIGSVGGLLKGGSASGGGINKVAQTVGVAQTGADAAKAAGLLGKLEGAGGAISSAAPYLAAAAVALPIISGLFKKSKVGSANLTSVDSFTLSGNSGSRKSQAGDLAGQVTDSLKSIAEQVNGTLGSFSTSIGISGDSVHVDPTGRGKLKKSQGGIDFNQDQEAAVKYAVADALKDGVLIGVSEATKRLLQSGGDIDQQLAKAVQIEAIPKLLKARLDPTGAAVDAVVDKFAKLVAIMDEAGASAEQRADAERLYRLELDDAKKSAGSAAEALKEYQTSLSPGGNSTFSLRDQEAAAKAALDPFLAKIDAGVTIDQQAYLASAQAFLDVERQLYGSTEAFFQAQAAIQAATGKAISAIENATPITGTAADPFAKATADAAARTAANSGATNEMLGETNDLLRDVRSLLQGTGGSDVSAWFAQTRGFTA